MCRFSGYRFRLFFREQGIKRRQIFWSRLSKHVKRGNFVTTGYFVVQFLCFWVYFSPIFLEQGIIWRQKFWSRAENFYFVGTSPYKSRSSTPPPPGAHLNIDWKGGPQRPSKEAPKGGGGRWSPGAHHFESLEPWSPDDSHGNFLEF